MDIDDTTPAQTEQRRHDRLNWPWSRQDRPVPRTVIQPLQAFLSTEAASGIVVLVAALVALAWANSPLSSSYEEVWTTELRVEVGGWVLAEDLRHWVNDLLMALFFFVVGLEVKREFVHGRLRDSRAAALPILCALGGMAVPALLYLALAGTGPAARGWGIPMATDIAFSLGVLALLGRRVPVTLKVFLLTLAVVDDIGAIAVIALFYSEGLSAAWLSLAVAVVAGILIGQRLGIRALAPYVVGAAVLWLAVFSSGVHATLAGVALGLLTPAWPFNPPEAVASDARAHLEQMSRLPPDGVADEDEQSTLLHVSALVVEAVSPLERLEHALHPWTSYMILPLFALANAGIVLDADALGSAVNAPVVAAVVVGLVVGKPLGVLAAAVLVTRTGLAPLPEGTSWRHVAGAGMLAGIGFAVSIFIAGLAFPPGDVQDAAKLGILVASLLAGAAGAALLAGARAAPRERP